MEAQKLTELLRATIDPNPEQRKAAEDQLAQVSLLPKINACTWIRKVFGGGAIAWKPCAFLIVRF